MKSEKLFQENENLEFKRELEEEIVLLEKKIEKTKKDLEIFTKWNDTCLMQANALYLEVLEEQSKNRKEQYKNLKN